MFIDADALSDYSNSDTLLICGLPSYPKEGWLLLFPSLTRHGCSRAGFGRVGSRSAVEHLCRRAAAQAPLRRRVQPASPPQASGRSRCSGGHSVGCHADNARPEPKRTSLISLVRPATVRSLDGSGGDRSRAVFPSTECVLQTSSVPQLPTTFWGR